VKGEPYQGHSGNRAERDKIYASGMLSKATNAPKYLGAVKRRREQHRPAPIFPNKMMMVRSATAAPRIGCGHLEQRFASVKSSAMVAQEHSPCRSQFHRQIGLFASHPSHFLRRPLSFAILVRKSSLHALRQNRNPQYW
jgi:hypothetical protein